MQSALQLSKHCGLWTPTSSRSDRSVRALRASCSNDNRCKQSQCSEQPGSTNSMMYMPGRVALTAAAAAAVLQICLPAVPAFAVVADVPASSAAAVSVGSSSSSSNSISMSSSSWRPVLGDMSLTAVAAAAPDAQQADDREQYMDELTAQVALPPELISFMQKVEKGSFNNLNKLQEARRSVGFERTPDGRVLLLTEDGEPFQVKNDMGVPGLLLLRDAGGYCYYLPPPDNNALVQIDLSDDAVVAQLFANHVWEELLEPLEVMSTADDGPSAATAAEQQQQQQQGPRMRLEQLRLTERQFRTTVSLAAGGQEMPEEPLEDLDAQEQ